MCEKKVMLIQLYHEEKRLNFKVTISNITMKTKINIVFLILSIWMSSDLHAQWINSISIQPASPTTADTITVLAACSFPSGGCSDHTQFSSIIGNDIFAGALHCLGPLSFICNFTDTFIIDPLPAGNFTFHFQIDAGLGPSPCTPGIVPGPSDSVSFVVSPFTNIPEFIAQDEVYAFPNPAKHQVQIKGLEDSEFPVKLELYSIAGKLIKKIEMESSGDYFEIGEIPDGIYQLQVETSKQRKLIIQLAKTK